MLATGGGLVFSGGTNDREFHAFDADNGKLLWEFPTNSGIIGQPTSFLVDGKQYIAVQSGWGVDSQGMQTQLNAAAAGQLSRSARGRGDLGVCDQVENAETGLNAEIAEIAEEIFRRERNSVIPRCSALSSSLCSLAAFRGAPLRFFDSSASRAIMTSVDLMIANASSPRRSFSSWIASPVMTAVSV